MIAGMNDDMQGRICYGGIAHAGPVGFQRAMWFSGDDACFRSPYVMSNYTYDCIALIPGASTYTTIAANLSGTTVRQSVLLFPSAGTFSALVIGDTPVRFGQTGNIAYTPYTWMRLIAGWGATPFFYKDGTSYAAPISATTAYGSLSGFWLGREGTLYGWRGIIRELAIYQRALTAGEIATLFTYDHVGGGVTADALFFNRGITPADWGDIQDVQGTPEICYIRGDNKIIKNGVIMNP